MLFLAIAAEVKDPEGGGHWGLVVLSGRSLFRESGTVELQGPSRVQLAPGSAGFPALISLCPLSSVPSFSSPPRHHLSQDSSKGEPSNNCLSPAALKGLWDHGVSVPSEKRRVWTREETKEG